MKILSRAIHFKDLEPADIVIFDEVGSEYVKKVLNKNLNIGIFKMRPYEIFISPFILFQLFTCAHHFNFSEAANHRRGFIFSFLFQLRNIYFEACLLSMKPKAVITFIDNSPVFHWLSRHSRRFPYIAIQNGCRLRYAISEDNKDYYLQHYFCWGSHEAELFGELGFKVENYYPVGSVLASLYFNQSCERLPNKYDILIVSSWRGNVGFSIDVVDTMRSMEIMDQKLGKYIALKKISAAVILRAERDSVHWNMPGIGNEYDYYRNIYGESVELIEADFAAKNIYSSMQSSELIISCLSSALIEAYGAGKKVLYCNFTGTSAYHCDFDPCIVTDIDDFEKFSRLLDEKLEQSSSDYLTIHSEKMKKVMNFSCGRPTYDVITNSLDKIIGEFICTN